MKHLKLLTAAIACSFTLLWGCKEDTDSMVSPAAVQHTKLSAEKLNQLQAALPAGYEQRLQKNAALLVQEHPEYREMVNRALNVLEPTSCDDNTAVSQWLDQQLSDWNNTVIYYAVVTGMLDFPQYDALLFENSSENQYFGVNGEYKQQETKTFKDLQRFWNIDSDNIVLAAMHGSMLRDRDKLIRIDMALYGDSPEVAAQWADLILQLLDTFPQYRNGDHPIFTFNAFAQGGFTYGPVGEIPSKIVMGDGIVDAYTALGYEDVAPQAILAHEFGHQIQFQLNLFKGPRTPEATRRTELMADAYSAYYLSHARGATMQWKRVQQFLQVFFNIGDCSFSSTGHHGTPTQRMAAARWGYELANKAQKQGHILTSQEFTALFEAQLPVLVKL